MVYYSHIVLFLKKSDSDETSSNVKRDESYKNPIKNIIEEKDKIINDSKKQIENQTNSFEDKIENLRREFKNSIDAQNKLFQKELQNVSNKMQEDIKKNQKNSVAKESKHEEKVTERLTKLEKGLEDQTE